MTTKTRNPEPETADTAIDHEARAAALEAELDALRAKLADQEAADAEAKKPRPARETHLVVLATGDSFRTASPVMTQHHVDGVGLVPVVNVFELGEEE